MTASTAGPRLKAFLLDYIVVFAYLALLALIGSILTFGPLGAQWSRLFSSPWRADLLSFFTAVLPVILYFALSEGSPRAATWGKRRVGLTVAGPGGASPGYLRSLLRSALKFLPWQLSHTAMLHIPGFPMSPGEPPAWSVWALYVVWGLVAVYLLGLTRLAGGRTLYDRVSGTTVVRRQGPRRKTD